MLLKRARFVTLTLESTRARFLTLTLESTLGLVRTK
jgi:hypothetical protein